MQRTRWYRLCLAGLVGLEVARPLAAQSDSTQAAWVEVRDAATRRLLAGARVSTLGDSLGRGLTDSTGVATVTVRRGSVLVSTRLGFRPETTAVSAAAWAAGVVQVALVPVAQALAGVAITDTSARVNGMMAEFEARRARRGGGASFIGPDVFARSATNKLTDHLRRGLLGIRLIDSAGVLMPVSTRGQVVRVWQGRRRPPGRDEVELVYCVLRIVVDGIPKEWGYDLNLLDPREVYGVEVYAGPSTIPAQYQSMGRDGYCGLILIWTRAK